MDIAIKPQYLTDEEGHRTAVVLSLEEFEAVMELVEDRNDAEALDRAIEESSGLFHDLDDVLERMKKDGRL